MKIKLSRLFVLLLLFCLLPITTAATVPLEDEETEVPYLDRTFLYIVDCSGSMGDYQDALNIGRQMLSDLLPAESTTVISFSEKAEEHTTGELVFDGETSVLAGIEKADSVLEELWSENPSRKVTVILFSDMNSTVEAADGLTPLTEESFQREKVRLSEIESRWSQYARLGNLNFYSLSWQSEPSDDDYPVSFSPISGGIGHFQPFDAENADFTREIFKTCVEAYTCVLTGSDEFQWAEVTAVPSGSSLTVSLDESYRTFLYLDQIPSGIANSGGPVEFLPWDLGADGYILMIENAESGLYTLDGVLEDGLVLCLTVPQPKITVNVSKDTVICCDDVAFSVGIVAGDSYLGYDDSSSSCLLKITAPGEEVPRVSAGQYNEVLGYYEFEFTPDKKGTHEITIYYTILGDDQKPRIISYELDVKPYAIKLMGQAQREYRDLRVHLQEIQEGEEISFRLSDYYKTNCRQLQFVVEAPEDPEVVIWEPISDGDGAVTVRGLKAGKTVLRYKINYYEDGVDTPDNTEEFTMEIHVVSVDSPISVWLIIGLAGAAAVIVVASVLLVRHIKSQIS